MGAGAGLMGWVILSEACVTCVTCDSEPFRALQILREELIRNMHLCGRCLVGELRDDTVSQLH